MNRRTRWHSPVASSAPSKRCRPSSGLPVQAGMRFQASVPCAFFKTRLQSQRAREPQLLCLRRRLRRASSRVPASEKPSSSRLLHGSGRRELNWMPSAPPNLKSQDWEQRLLPGAAADDLRVQMSLTWFRTNQRNVPWNKTPDSNPSLGHHHHRSGPFRL